MDEEEVNYYWQNSGHKNILIKSIGLCNPKYFTKNEVLDEINTILYRFIWKKDTINTKAWERVKRIILCSAKEKGGLEMINLHNFQNSFLIEWACKLIKNRNENHFSFAKSFFEKIGGTSIFNSKINLKNMKGLETVTNPFWRAVLKAWIENNDYSHDIRINDSLNNNEDLTVNN